MRYRATSTRRIGNHPNTFYSAHKQNTIEWAKREHADGYVAQVFELSEVLIFDSRTQEENAR